MLLCHRWLEYFGLIPIPRFSARLPIFLNVASSARNSVGLASANTFLISAACLRKIGAINESRRTGNKSAIPPKTPPSKKVTYLWLHVWRVTSCLR